MNASVFRFLKKKHLADPSDVNILFVSAYVLMSNLSVERCSYIKKLIDVENNNVEPFIKLLKDSNILLTLEELIKLFEFVQSPSDRIITGAVYTPADVRNRIIRDCVNGYADISVLKFADISCGCGAFLMDVASCIHRITGKSFATIFRDNIFGIDVQSYAVERTKIILALLALENNEDTEFEFNIIEADTLDYKSEDWDVEYDKFDIIIGNPPYVCSRHLSNSTLSKLKKYEVCKSGHPDLYIPFFQIATEMLVDNGTLGFITMNSFFRSVNGRSLREYFSTNLFKIRIIDFRGVQIFCSKSTYTCLFYLNKSEPSLNVEYMLNERGDLNLEAQCIQIPYSDLDNVGGWVLNEHCRIKRLESIGTPLGTFCKTRHGIATLSNRIYVFDPTEAQGGYYSFVKNNKVYKIEQTICRNIVNPNKLNSDVQFDSIVEKVIYPYEIDGEGKVRVINEELMRSQYPYTYKYLLDFRDELDERDKGNTDKYPVWYAYGRTQSLSMPEYKLFFPKFANKKIHCVLKDDKDLLLYNGLAFVSDDIKRLKLLKKIMESSIFWEYIKTIGKPYSSGYFSLSGVDIKSFGIPNFLDKEIDCLLKIDEKKEVDKYLLHYYE